MRYKAVFFDRDHTLTCANSKVKQWEKQQIESWSGHVYHMDYDRMMYLFELAEYPESGIKSEEEEIRFWNRYYECLLREEKISDEDGEKAKSLFEHIWLHERNLYPEVIRVLEQLKKEGYQLGVISDTTPSLQHTLEQLNLGKYFDCYICSDNVGVMKPEPAIYQAALDALNLSAEECIYIDDYDVEVQGARNMGFTAFHINRDAKDTKRKWEISSLSEILDYLHKEE